MDGKLRNMTSLYLTGEQGILCLYRIGSKVANNKYIGSAGGHFEQDELNDARKCVLREMQEELGLTERGLDRLIHTSYDLLGYISFLTGGEDEVRAWTIERGTKAPQAAGKIHSDFEKGFIRAEIVTYEDLIACGSIAAAKEKGLYRSEGKEYVMKDGDVVLFRFNV